MVKIATIGTSWITGSFIGGLDLLADMYTLTAVYSRTRERAEAFLSGIGKSAEIFTDLTEMAKSKDIDAVYIASPNSLHFEQAMLMIENGKHVLVEKPIVITRDEFIKLSNAAKEHDVIFMEAIIPIHTPARKIIKEALPKLGRIQSSRFQFCQFSSKYNAYVSGNNPNVFNPHFAAGTLMDLGIYCVYPAIDLFALPQTVCTQASFLESGSDSSVSSIYKYNDHIVTIISSKTCQSDLPSEIIGDNGKLTIGHISKYDDVSITVDGVTEHLVGNMTKEQLMSYEAKDFYRYITDKNGTAEEYDEMCQLSHTVCSVMEDMRNQANIKFY